jgi:DNA-binding beta-propeller fold protein YncE
MAKCNGALYIACRDKIMKIDILGKIQREYKTEGNNIKISATKDGHLVYSNYISHTVTAITDQADRVWQYTHPKMKEPYGLDVDSAGNIFIAAKTNNNIHVLSGAGALIRIMEDIPRPVFIKLMEERGVCCVCSDHKLMKVYKLSQ